jgi:hypothetical protein
MYGIPQSVEGSALNDPMDRFASRVMVRAFAVAAGQAEVGTSSLGRNERAAGCV